MEKKQLALIGGVFLLVFVLSGCDANKKQSNPSAKEITPSEKKTETNKETTADSPWDQARLQAAIKSGKKVKCVMSVTNTPEEGASQTELWLDGEKYRSETTINGKKNYAVFDGKTFYAWQGNQSKGFRMDKDCLDQLQQEAETDSAQNNMEQPKTAEDVIKGNAAASFHCEKVSDVDLTVPSNIEFIDQCEMIKKMKDQAKTLQESFKNLPGFQGNGAEAK